MNSRRVQRPCLYIAGAPRRWLATLLTVMDGAAATLYRNQWQYVRRPVRVPVRVLTRRPGTLPVQR